MINLKSLPEEALIKLVNDHGLPAFRARQLLHWIYEKNITEIKDITVFSKEIRHSLSSIAWISSLQLVESQESGDGTVKYLFELEDREKIESVLISDNDRSTLCVSSQVGCAMGCRFCLTGMIGLRRNLKAYEITDQVLSVNRLIAPRRITNIVFMGMGEPLMNLGEVCNAIRLTTQYTKISGRQITVSTSGISPNIRALSRKAPSVNLAISLNAPDDRTRSLIMPLNNKYSLKTLLKACRDFPLPKRRRITFEYVLIKDINDSVQHARKTIQLLRGIPAKVNLIPFNPISMSEFKRPKQDTILSFQEVLLKGGVTAIIRKSKGEDILAACGQLSGRYPQKMQPAKQENC